MAIDAEKSSSITKRAMAVFILFCIIIFIAFRAKWVGHLLIWDEAISLCTIRSFLPHGTDDFSNWFWRHPPLFSLLMMFLSPLKSGFAERVEWMSIVIGVINLLLLFRLNQRLLGTSIALWSIFFIAVQPGSVFFDVWIKTDHTVTTFGLLAIILLSMRQPLYSGLSLGLAMLSKETGIFYVIATLLIWLCGGMGQRTRRDLAALTFIPLIACGWWYFGVKILVDQTTFAAAGINPMNPWYLKIFGGSADFVKFAFSSQSGWNRSWNYYFTNIPLITGFHGFVIAFVGAIFNPFIWRQKNAEALNNQATPISKLWPLFLLIPSYTILSLLHSKVPWIVIVLLPAWATLQGIAVAEIIGFFRRIGNNSKSCNLIQVITSSLVIIGCITAVWKLDYEKTLQHTDIGQWRGAHYSRDIALQMNQLVSDRERILVTSFHYWKGLGPGHACPVFAYYFTKKTEVLIRPHETTYNQLVSDIKRYRIDWALLSPEPPILEHIILPGFINNHNLIPKMLEKAVIFKTTAVYREDFK